MTLTPDALAALADLVHALRPKWDLPGIAKHLEPLAGDQRNAYLVVHDVLIQAGKQQMDTPAHLGRALRGCPLAKEAAETVRNPVSRCHLHPDAPHDDRGCGECRRAAAVERARRGEVATPTDTTELGTIGARIKRAAAERKRIEAETGRSMTDAEAAALFASIEITPEEANVHHTTQQRRRDAQKPARRAQRIRQRSRDRADDRRRAS